MADQTPSAAVPPNGGHTLTRLDSWKEIATYLRRDVTTVRRWEKREGLPVHRHSHERRDSVYAYTSEIDDWWQSRGNGSVSNANDDGATAERSRESGPVPTPLHPPARAARWAWALAATFFAATLGLTAFLLVGPRSAGEAGDELRFHVFPPPETSFGAATLSPDGRQLAFTATEHGLGGKSRLWIQQLDGTPARSLPDTEGAAFPFWSPGGDTLGFFSSRRLWTIAVDGGSARSLADAPDGRGGTWNRQGTILFAPRFDGALFQVASGGGVPTPVTALVEGRELGHLWPQFLPDGRRFLYLADTHEVRAADHHVYVGTLDGAEPRRVLSVASNAVYSPPGYVLYERERRLFAQPFDAAGLTFSGEPLLLFDRIQQLTDSNHKAEFSISENGRLTYRAMQSPASRLVWHDRSRPVAALAPTPAEYQEPVFSPDGRHVAVGIFDPRPSPRFGFGVVNVRSDIFVIDRSTGQALQLTSDDGADWGPVWSPDGQRIVFSSNRRVKDLELFIKEVGHGQRVETPLVAIGKRPVAQSWSPNGQFVVYAAYDPATRMDLWLLPMTGDRTPIPLLRSEFGETQGQISPDGRWLAFTSDESGRPEVYVTTFPHVTTKWRISSHGAADPRWRRDGKELFLITDDRRLMAVPIRAGSTFAHGEAVALFDTGVPTRWYNARNVYDVSPEGRFLFMAPVESEASVPVTIVLNWHRSTLRE